jgi:dienelactone hydrolase
MSEQDPSRRAGWVHHPRSPVLGPLDLAIDLPVTTSASPLTLHMVYTDDGLYLPAVSRCPGGRGPCPVIIAIHGSSGGLGVPYLVDELQNRGWALEVMLAHGYAVVFAEGRMEHEDAYGTGIPFLLDHNDMVTMLRYVARQPWADPERIGFFGVSHGGEMQMKLAAEVAAHGGAPMPAALAMCEPAAIEFLGLRYEGARKESNLQFQLPLADARIDTGRAIARIDSIPATLPMLVVGREEDHLQGLFMKLHELLGRAGKTVEWASFSHPEHAYQFGPRRGAEGYRPDSVQQSTMERVMAFLNANVRDRK